MSDWSETPEGFTAKSYAEKLVRDQGRWDCERQLDSERRKLELAEDYEEDEQPRWLAPEVIRERIEYLKGLIEDLKR